MKIRQWAFKALILPAVLLFVGLAATVSAADFFPLDIWEEMETWSPKGFGSASTGPEAVHVHRSPVPAVEGKTPVSFPWDVREELHALGSHARGDASRFFVKIDASNRNRYHPYWLPVELQWDPSPAADPVNFAVTDPR